MVTRSAAVLFFLLAMRAGAGEQWIKLTTPHFQLYTSAGEKKGREAILHFERVRNFFLLSSPSKKAAEFPVRIVAFRSEKEYQPYRVNDFAAAYFAHDENRDYIVMQDIDAEHYPVAIHEYTHLVIEHSGLRIPVWMNEGWADLYSTLKPKGQRAMIGEVIPGRARALLSSPWIPLTDLGSVDRQSPLYNERDKAGMFYAESWAFMHMLYLAPGYSKQFAPFVFAISAGKSLPEACQEALGKPVAEVQRDLEQYLRKDQLFAAVFDVKLTKPEEQPELEEVNAFESGLVLADLLALTRKTSEAKAAYGLLAAENPKSPEIEESLGYLSWKAGDRAAARAHFLRALENGSRSARMCYRLAILSTGPEIARALEKALEIKPDYLEARLQLGIAFLDAKNYQGCLDQLHQIKKMSEDIAPVFFSVQAYAYAGLGKDDAARKSAESARKWAKMPQQAEQAEALIKYLDSKK